MLSLDLGHHSVKRAGPRNLPHGRAPIYFRRWKSASEEAKWGTALLPVNHNDAPEFYFVLSFLISVLLRDTSSSETELARNVTCTHNCTLLAS